MAATPRLDLTQLKLQAKELRKAHRAGEVSACTRIKNHLSRLVDATETEIRAYALSLREAQFVIARENGFGSWAALKKHVDSSSTEDSPVPTPPKADLNAERIADFFFNKAFTDDEPKGEPATIPKQRRKLTPTEIEFIRAAASPVEVYRNGKPGFDRWTGICDVERMAELVRQEPTLLQTVGPLLIRVTVAMRGCAASTKFLLDHDVPMIVAETGYNCLHEAAWAGDCTENLRHVFESGDVDAAGVSVIKPHTGWPDNVSLLYWSAYKPVEQAKLFLEYGADPEVPIKGNGERGTTVLQHAVASTWGTDDPERIENAREFAEFILAHGAHYDIYSACARNDLDRVRELVKQDAATVVSQGEARMTPLHWAARTGAMACAEWLLDHGAVVDASTVTRRTPLHLAAENGELDAIWLLSDHGADLNAQDSKGRTPLHRATYQGQADAAEVLIVLGADTRIRTKAGKNPLETARLDCKFLKGG